MAYHLYVITLRQYRDGRFLGESEIGRRNRWRDAYDLANTFVVEETVQSGGTLTGVRQGRTGTEYRIAYPSGTVGYVAVPDRLEH